MQERAEPIFVSRRGLGNHSPENQLENRIGGFPPVTALSRLSQGLSLGASAERQDALTRKRTEERKASIAITANARVVPKPAELGNGHSFNSG